MTWTGGWPSGRWRWPRGPGVGARAMRAALDSSPLWDAARVEDTLNLMGHALRKPLAVIAVLKGRGRAAGITELARQAGGRRSWLPPA